MGVEDEVASLEDKLGSLSRIILWRADAETQQLVLGAQSSLVSLKSQLVRMIPSYEAAKRVEGQYFVGFSQFDENLDSHFSPRDTRVHANPCSLTHTETPISEEAIDPGLREDQHGSKFLARPTALGTSPLSMRSSTCKRLTSKKSTSAMYQLKSAKVVEHQLAELGSQQAEGFLDPLMYMRALDVKARQKPQKLAVGASKFEEAWSRIPLAQIGVIHEKTVSGLWNRWKHGNPTLPSYDWLDQTYRRTRWVEKPRDRRYLERHAALIREITNLVEDGAEVDVILRLADLMAEKLGSLNKLAWVAAQNKKDGVDTFVFPPTK